MYQVYLNDTAIHDPVADIALIGPALTLADNTAGTFDFEIGPDNPGYYQIRKLASKVRVLKDGEELFRGRVLTDETAFSGMKAVSCEGELAYLCDSVQRPGVYKDLTPGKFLARLLAGHNSQVEAEKRITPGFVTVTSFDDSTVWKTSYGKTTLEHIKEQLVNKLGGHLVLRRSEEALYLDYLTEYSGACGQTIEFGTNLLNYSESATAAEIATVLIPLGEKIEADEAGQDELERYVTVERVNGGKDYIESPEAVQTYGRIARTFEFKNTSDPAELLELGREYLKSTQFETLTLSVKAIDLNLTDEAADPIRLGDLVRVCSKPHGMDHAFPVLKRTYHLDNPAQDTIVLGDSLPVTMNDGILSGNKELSEKLEDLPSQTDTLQKAKKQATDIINANGENGHISYNPTEMLIMDTDSIHSAKKVWRFNMGGLGYSKNGYQGPFSLAITMDGRIVADFITAGVLNGNIIKGNSITADKLNVNNLDALAAMIGDWHIENGNLYTTVYDNSGAERTVFMQGFRSWAGHNEDTWVYSVQKNSIGLFIVTAGGNIRAQSIYCADITAAGESDFYGTLNMNGHSIVHVGDITYTSDQNAKQNIHGIERDERFLRFFQSLKPSVYQFKRDGEEGNYHAGYIAQEVKAAMDACGISESEFAGYCDMGEDGLGLRYNDFIPLNTMAIQHLTGRLEKIEKALAEKDGENE